MCRRKIIDIGTGDTFGGLYMWGAHTKGEEELFVQMLRLRGDGINPEEILRQRVEEAVREARASRVDEGEIGKQLTLIAEGMRKEVKV